MTTTTPPAKSTTPTPQTGPRSTTRRTLRRLRGWLVVATVVVLASSLGAFLAMDRTIDAVTRSTAPAIIEISTAHAALAEADSVAIRGVEAGEPQLAGFRPGREHQDQIVIVSQSLARVAETNATGERGSRDLQVIGRLLVSYQVIVQAAADHPRDDDRQDGVTLGTADLWESSRVAQDIVGRLDALRVEHEDALERQLGAFWMHPAVFGALWAGPAVALFALLLATQFYLRWTFRRTTNPWLILATCVLFGLVAVMLFAQDGLDRVEGAKDTVDAVVSTARSDAAETTADGQEALTAIVSRACGDALATCGIPVEQLEDNASGQDNTSGQDDASEGAATARTADGSRTARDDLEAADERTWLWALILVLALSVLALVLLGLQERIDEYRFRSGTPAIRWLRRRNLVATVTALLLLAAAIVAWRPGGLLRTDEHVSVLALWEDQERQHFEGEVLGEFEDQTGIEVDYEGTREVLGTLRADVQQGTPPDVAVVPSPGALTSYLKDGLLHPIGEVIGDRQRAAYHRQWLLPDDDGEIYAIPVKASLKSLVWHAPGGGALAASGRASWCMGMSLPPESGWPGTDWIETILLRQSGRDVYHDWAAGRLSWESEAVRSAWRTWGDTVGRPGAVEGGPATALLTDFFAAARPLVDDSPSCDLAHQPSSILDAYGDWRAGEDFDFSPFPALGPEDTGGVGREWVASADLAVMFNDTPQAKALMRFLASDEGQRIWPSSRDDETGLSDASGFSLNTRVPADVFTDDVRRRIAGHLTDRENTLCFDASDLMPVAMRGAFHRAVQEYLSDRDELPTILEGLERVRLGVPDEEWTDFPCAHPGADD